MKSSLKTQLHFSKMQRTGLFALLLIIVGCQIAYFCLDFETGSRAVAPEEAQWVSLKPPAEAAAPKYRIYPFNPNFITDFKGYRLGMSTAEIDRLLEFRKTNRYVNSADEFQAVTKVSDSLLAQIAPYFKFPDWVQHRNAFKPYQKKSFEKQSVKVLDINLATAEDLKKVYGIGDGLSARILKEKEKFGGFVSMKQMKDIWGLQPEVIEKLEQSFTVGAVAEIKKVKINTASLKELMLFPYFRYNTAKAIITYRTMNGEIKGVADLSKISEFPVDKVDVIALYLEF